MKSEILYKEYENKVKQLLIEEYKEAPPLALVHSFGCQQNESDSERIKGMLFEMGYGFTDRVEEASIIIYNTCAVRENAELKVFGNLGELKHLKEENQKLIIGVCGCMVQQKQVTEKIKKTYKQVDMVFGTFALYSMPKLLFEVLTERKRNFDIDIEDNSIHEDVPVLRNGKFKASVPVIYGCNNFCSYCIVPYVRGRERSRKAEDIVKEVKALSDAGYKEIMLLGQNVNSYGKDLDENVDFSKLLRMVNDIEGDFIIRFISSHPKDATKELIDTIFECKKVAKHFHLPLQSGSDRVLNEMNRKYTCEQYLEIIRYARSKDPEFSFSTDIIIGFPNEQREDFEKTLEVIQKVKYDNIYSFIYSKRTGTKAALIDDRTSDEDKGFWMRELLKVQREISTEHYRRFIGRTLRVLADAKGKKSEDYLTGKSNENIIVEFEGNEELIGKFVNVEITGAHNWALTGKLKN